MLNKKIPALVERVADALLKKKKCLTVAESCTGGWLAKVLTDLSGSSAWFERGFVTYSNQAKNEMLAVPDSTLERHGAVSEETVSAMVLGAIKKSHADFSISVSGIAGPTGGTTGKPVGLVWFAWAKGDDLLSAEKQIFKGDRNAVREQAVEYALAGLIKYL